MDLSTPINSKTQAIKLSIDSERDFRLVLSIIKYHADNVVSVTMSRSTATGIDGRYFGAVPPSLSNPFNDNIEINNQVITLNDSEPAGDVTIIYERRFAYFDDEIRRKIRNYTNANTVKR